ncbi:MAG: PilZ domain-containing protein [Pseudomonadota bacterium]
MHPSRELSQEELDYIQQLFDEATRNEVLPSTEIGLLIRPENLPLFDTLLNSNSMQLRANLGDLGFVFPVRLHREADGHISMQLSMPEFYEIHGKARSWRAPVEGNAVRLIDPSGRLRDIHVLDISQSGLALADNPTEAIPEGERLSGLFLELPHTDAPLPVEGTVTRIFFGESGTGHRLALSFDNLDEALQEAIKDYLFQRHRELQPGPR